MHIQVFMFFSWLLIDGNYLRVYAGLSAADPAQVATFAKSLCSLVLLSAQFFYMPPR